jgi:hypothetical protein
LGNLHRRDARGGILPVDCLARSGVKHAKNIAVRLNFAQMRFRAAFIPIFSCRAEVA